MFCFKERPAEQSDAEQLVGVQSVLCHEYLESAFSDLLSYYRLRVDTDQIFLGAPCFECVGEFLSSGLVMFPLAEEQPGSYKVELTIGIDASNVILKDLEIVDIYRYLCHSGRPRR